MKVSAIKQLLWVLPVALSIDTIDNAALASVTEQTGLQEIIAVLDTGEMKFSSVSSARDGISTVTVPTKDLIPGVYLLRIHARNDDGIESAGMARLVYVTDREPLAGVEYFIDNDPGEGNGYPFNSENSEGLSFSVSTGDLDCGLHTLSVRSQNSVHEWSDVVSKHFLVTRDSAGIEWFYDKDPGIGRGNQAELNDMGIVFLPTSDLAPGVHTLSIRNRDLQGNWSATVTHLLYVTEPHGVITVEYYVDEDPGEGKANEITLSDNDEASIVIPTGDLSIGNHTISIRAKEGDTDWHTIFEAPFDITFVSGVKSISRMMNVSVMRADNRVILTGVDLDPESLVEIITIDGTVVYRGIWTDTISPLDIKLDSSIRNSILNITSPSGSRLTKRIR